MSVHIYITAIALILSLYPKGSLCVNCPAECYCSWEVESLIADCSHRGLRNYPNFDSELPFEHLDLSHNFLQDFPTEYTHISSLINLDLSNNDIQELADYALIGFTSLRVLSLANNSIQSWSAINPNLAFQHAYSLQKLSLAGNRLSRIADSEGAPLLVSDRLLELDLSNCGITQMKNFLGGMRSLQTLHLAGNNLTTVSAIPSTSLRTLNISNCSLIRVDAKLLISLPLLEVLDLSRNPGVILPNNWEADTMVKIDLSFCNLNAVDLSGMPYLRMAHLQGNMLRVVSDSMFANNTALELLDLSRNVIRELDATAFYNLHSLVELNLSYNEIIRIDRNQFQNNVALTSIDFSRNIFNEFIRFTSDSLRTLNMSWCEIMTVDVTVFLGLKSIVNLDLSHNLITEFPSNMESSSLKKLDLSMCRLSLVRNTTFHGYPSLYSLKLSGNRFTNPFRPDYFKSNLFLHQIWLGDNLWRCDCQDRNFMSFYDYLTMRPKKLKDERNVKCSSPVAFYGLPWENACLHIWYPTKNDETAQKVWLILMIILLIIGCFLVSVSCFKKYLRGQVKRRNRLEREENERELQAIRLQNSQILEHEAQQNAPTAYESMLPSYEDAILMPKLNRNSKSMINLPTNRKPLRILKVDPEASETEANEDPLILDHHRFRSVDALSSNRDKERTAPIGAYRRTGRIDPQITRRLSIGDSHFQAGYLKSQNLQSAEKIGNFQSYENSPYTKRRPKYTEPVHFKRASLRDSLEFLTDSEFSSKPGSPFAQRRPPATDTPRSQLSVSSEKIGRGRVPADSTFLTVEEHFGRDELDKKSLDSSTSDFQVMRSSDVDLTATPRSSSPIIVVHTPQTPVRESKF